MIFGYLLFDSSFTWLIMCIASLLSFYLSISSWILPSIFHTASSLSGISYTSVFWGYVSRDVHFVLYNFVSFIFGFLHMMDSMPLLLSTKFRREFILNMCFRLSAFFFFQKRKVGWSVTSCNKVNTCQIHFLYNFSLQIEEIVTWGLLVIHWVFVEWLKVEHAL